MKDLHIAMLSYHTCPLASLEGKETGGMNVYVLELAKELSRKGCKIDIFTRCQGEKDEKIVILNENLRVIHLTAGEEKQIDKKLLLNYLDDFVNSYENFVRQENLNYDLLHCHYYLSGLIGLQINKDRNMPIFISFHTLALMKNLVARNEREEETPERVEAEFRLIREVDKVITSSSTDALYTQYLYDCPKEKLVVIPPGIDVEHFHPMDQQKAKDRIHEYGNKIVLFVGRIEPLKGIDALIYAMKILVNKNPNLPVKLLIAGGDITQKKLPIKTEMEKLNRLRHLLHIPDIVEFVGQKTQAELPYYYNAAEVVIMPSHYESFGIAALEAMACGTPVITSNVSGIASIIDKQREKLITTVNNPLLLASQIEHLLINDNAHRKVSEGIRNKVADLTWSNTANKMLKLYKSI